MTTVGSDASVSTTAAPSAPYEGVLNTALTKLTDQVLIFLLAYVILLIGLATVGSGLLAPGVRELLYIIPVLGIGAYAYLQRRQIQQGVRVRSGLTEDGGVVAGIRSSTPQANLPDNVDVTAGITRRGGTVIAVDIGGGAAASADLLRVFDKLDASGQLRLLTYAQKLANERPGRSR